MNTITFEAITPDSLPMLADILNYYVENTTVTFHTRQLTADDMKSKVFFSQPQFVAFLIKRSGQSIGYCAVSPWKVQEAYTHTGEINIYLHPDHTSQGIGMQTIDHLQKHAKAVGITNLIAGICSENTASIRLFERAGFEPCAHFRQVGRKFGRLLDTVYLQKMLA